MRSKKTLTINSIKHAFVCRDDYYAIQYYNSRRSKWEFRKENLPLNEDIIRQHILGVETIAAYNISPNDEVIWCCLDIDSHRGEMGTEDLSRKVIGVLRNYGIPFLLEASGSPNSYHIWVSGNKTKTYNAYRLYQASEIRVWGLLRGMAKTENPWKPWQRC